MSFFKKVPVLSIVLGVLILAYAIVSYFVDSGFFSLTYKVGKLVIGFGLIAFVLFVILPNTNKKNQSVITLRTIESVIILFGAIVGFILPVFEVNINFIDISSSGSFWFGLALVLSGSIELYLGVFNKINLKSGLFFLNLLFVIFGTYVYATNMVDAKIKLVTLITLLSIGAILLFIGMFNIKSKK